MKGIMKSYRQVTVENGESVSLRIIQKSIMMIACIVICSGILTACGNGYSVGKPKEINIFDTKYSIPENWLVENYTSNNHSESMIVYMSEEKPEKIYSSIVITRVGGVLKGTSSYAQAMGYLSLLSDSMAAGIFKTTKDKLEVEPYNKKETPGIVMKGSASGGMYHEVYMFMNSKEDAVMIDYSKNLKESEIDASNEVKKIVDSMKFSYDGFR